MKSDEEKLICRGKPTIHHVHEQSIGAEVVEPNYALIIVCTLLQ